MHTHIPIILKSPRIPQLNQKEWMIDVGVTVLKELAKSCFISAVLVDPSLSRALLVHFQ